LQVLNQLKGFIMIDKKDQLAALRNAALMGVAAVALMAVPAVAQEQDDDDDEIVVTGSRIERGSNFTGVGPTTVLTKADIDISGKANIGDFLEELPSVTFTADGANANNGSGGLSTVNLRGLGASRLLVLFNGRRMNPVGSGTGNLVDLQIFPSSVISGITVLKDGAAAVYGADAMSGVLDFTTPKNFEGVDFVARSGISERGDGAFWNVGMTSGVTSDRGSAMLSLGYREQEGIYQADRPISDCPRLEPAWGGLFGIDVANDQCSGSSFIPAGRIYTSFGSLLVDQPGAGAVPRGFSFFGGDAFNFNPLNYLRTPSTTFNAFAKADYELTETINVELELMYSKRRSDQDLAPVPLGNGAQFTYGLIIPDDNPFNVQFWDQVRTNLVPSLAPGYSEAVRYRKRMLDVGARLFSQTSDTVRAVIAFDGIVPGEGNLPFLGGAKWDAYYSIDANNGTDENRNLIDMFRVEQALTAEIAPGATSAGNGVVDVDGQFYRCADALARQLGCEPLNMFGNNSITPGAAAFIRLNTIDGFSSEGTMMAFNVQNTLFETPAGEVKALIGIERRVLSGSTIIDAAISNGYSSGNPATSTNGRLSATDVFGEIAIPIVANQPMMQSLDLELAYRVSNYDTFDAGDTYRIAAAWKPVNDILIRGGTSTSFRAPSINDLFNGGSGGFPTYSDPCSDTGGSLSTNPQCIADGVGAGSGFVQTSQQLLNFGFGSRIGGQNLLPETGRQFNIGAVYTPSTGLLSKYNLQFALDYADIEIRDAITAESFRGFINDCYGGATSDPLACARITRQPGGDILRVNTFRRNDVDGVETLKSYDFEVRGAKEVGNGTVDFAVTGTYLKERGFINDLGLRTNFVGSCGGFVASCGNQWRMNTRLGFSNEKLRVVWSSRILSPVEEDEQAALDLLINDFGYSATDAAILVEPYVIRDWFTYHDINARYAVSDTMTVSVGVDNIFDKQPPYWKEVDGFFSATENTPFATYDTVGRSMYVQFDKSF